MGLNFGTGGVPLTAKSRDSIDGVERIRELGLDSMELEFVYQVFLNEPQAKALRQKTEELNVVLSVHGSYFVNLASKDKQKWHASIERVKQAAKIGDLAGARYLTFHPGFRQGRKNDVVTPLVKEGIQKILEDVDKNNYNIKITPELTGKASQWGDLEELVDLVKEIDHKNLGFCFDFAHKHARDGGGYNSEKEFRSMLDYIKAELGSPFMKDMHIHLSGINYSDKGERNHLTMLGEYSKYIEEGLALEGLENTYKELEKKSKIGPADMQYVELLRVLKEYEVEGIVVCESPNLEQDALLFKEVYKKL